MGSDQKGFIADVRLILPNLEFESAGESAYAHPPTARSRDSEGF